MEILSQFKDYLLEKDKSKNTIECYERDASQFLNWYEKDINEITKQNFKNYTNYLLEEKGLGIKTINRKLVSVNQFIVFLNDTNDKKIEVKVPQLKIENQHFAEDMLGINVAQRIVSASEKKNDVRAITIFYTLFYTGARVSEMLQIKVKDIDKDSITIKGKGSKYRELLIPKKLKDQFKKYAEVRSDTSEYLFNGERGAINRQTVHNIIKYYTGQARGIDKSLVHAHSFRHLYAQSLGELGVTPVVIAQLLGHSLNVTGLYMQNSKKDLLKIINKMDLKITKKGV